MGVPSASDDVKYEVQIWWQGSGTKWDPFYVPTSGGVDGGATSFNGTASAASYARGKEQCPGKYFSLQ